MLDFCIGSGREDEALAECNAALKITPGHFDASRVRVDVLRKLKRYDEVIRSCDALLNTGKPSSELYELRALAKEKLRDYQGAIEDQTLAIALKPGAAVLPGAAGRFVSGYRRTAVGPARLRQGHRA